MILLTFVQEGMAAYHEGLSLARRFRDDECACEILGTWPGMRTSNCFLAVFEGERGHYDQAETYFQQGIVASQLYGFRDFVPFILAQIELARGHYAEAAAYLQQALPLLRIYGAAEDKAIALPALGELELTRGDLNAADTAFRELFEVGPADFLAPLALGYFGRARLAAFRHQYQEAREFGDKSLQMLEDLKHVRAPEVRAWLETLPKPRFQAFRNLRKRDT